MKDKKMKMLIMLMAICFSFNSYAQQVKGVKNINAQKLEKKLQQSMQLIDVRPANEFKEGHLANAINIDVNSPDFEAQVQQLSKNKKLYVYCRTGRKSVIATKKLDSLGFSKIYNLTTGIEGWKKENKAVVKK
jgi:rhodanese-related sulfurtransferase